MNVDCASNDVALPVGLPAARNGPLGAPLSLTSSWAGLAEKPLVLEVQTKSLPRAF